MAWPEIWVIDAVIKHGDRLTAWGLGQRKQREKLMFS